MSLYTDLIWDYPLPFLIANLFFLLSYLVILCVLRYGAKVRFDRFQISCILIFCLIFLCKHHTLFIPLGQITHNMLSFFDEDPSINFSDSANTVIQNI